MDKNIDYDLILKNLRNKGYGDIPFGRFDEFESSINFNEIGEMTTKEYYREFLNYIKKEQIGEVKKHSVSTYDPKKDSREEISRAIKRAKEEDVSYNDDGTVSVKENFNKINLSEKEIISIFENEKKIRIKKSELLESISNSLIFEADMNDEVRRGFESGDHDYKEILGDNLVNQLAIETFEEIKDNIRRRTGKENVTFQDVQELLSNSLLSAAKEEYRIGIENLERKAVSMIQKQYNIPINAVEFDAKIVGIPPEMFGRSLSQREMDNLSNQLGLRVGKINREGLKFSKGNTPKPQNKSEVELKPKVKRRRLTNAMIHGAARKSQNLHHLDDEIRTQNPQLSNNYANIMSANDANYFLLDDSTIKREGESGIHAGNVRLDLSNPQKPKIIAQGMIFPILLHELSKGVLELMSLWGLPEDEDVRKYVLDQTDNLSSETNDIRLGTKIWEKFVEQIPIENQEVISLTWNLLQELPDNEFNSIIEGLIEKNSNAQQKVRRLAQEALEELRRESSEDVFGGYEDSPNEDDEDETIPTKDADKEDDELELIDKEDDEPNYENMSKRDLENEIDKALDDGDMDLVRYLGGILNKK